VAIAADRDLAATRRRLARWLAARTGVDRVDVGELSVPGLSGFSNETILLDATWDEGSGPVSHALVVRVEPSGHQVFPSTEFDAQVRVLQALRAEGSVPVPAVRWFEQDRSVLGDRFLVMERVVGEVPADNPSYHADGWLPALDEGARAAVWTAGIDTMAAIHRLDHRAAGLGWIESRTPAQQLELDHAYRAFAASAQPFPPLDRALDRLGEAVPPPAAEPALCWGDSRIGNMIFAPDGTVAAVLDWEMVTVGDPVQDLAWYLLIDRHHHEAFGVPRLAGLPDRVTTIRRWESATGRSAEHLDWYELLGAVRYTAIVTRVLVLLDDTGVLPGGAEMAYDHTGSQLLERLLDERGR
jgi:aminoglycoside phosphotransferase (APT) family kinase protein